MSFDAMLRLRSLFEGRGFVLLLAALTLLGHVFSLDGITVCLTLALCSFGILVSGTLLPLIPSLLIFIYQISVENSPAIPSFSDYYFTGWRAPAFMPLLAFLIGTCIYTAVRRGDLILFTLSELKFSLPLAAAFLLNGAFSGEWSVRSFGFGALQILSFFVIGYFFRLGLRGYSVSELTDYFSFVCTAVAAVLIIETAHLYAFGGVISNGTANKGDILYGWGIWTTAGMDMAVLIPIIFMRAARSVHPAPYLLIAHLTYGSAVLTLSRNALIFGAAALISSAVLYVKYAPRGKALLRAYMIVLSAAVLFLPIYFGGLASLLEDYFDRGLSDNGRLSLWRYGIEKFLEAPVFGKGFYAIEPDTFRAQNFFPAMLHNTVIELLASMGTFGIVAYAVYRANMLCGAIKRINRDTAYIFISMITLLLMSLFDNFIFYIQPMFLFSVEHALIQKSD